MAYKYFTQALLESDLNLNEVFSDQQKEIKNNQNVAYGLPEIAEYLEDVTNKFKSQDVDFISMDTAIQEIINKYYKSKKIENPFTKTFKKVVPDPYQEGVVPSDTIIVDLKDKKVINKGTVAPKPTTKSEPIVEPVIDTSETILIETTPPNTGSPAVDNAIVKADDLILRIEGFKKTIKNAKTFLEDADTEEEKEEVLARLRKQYRGLELLDEEEFGEFEQFKKQSIEDLFKENNQNL